MNKIIVAGNWKMNKTFLEAKEFVARLNDLNIIHTKVILAVPSIYLDALFSLNSNKMVSIAAQNCAENKFGAFTGEVSAYMLSSMGIKHCIIGHSERRAMYGETNAIIESKINQCIEAKITPILCIGESKEQREKGETMTVLTTQLDQCLASCIDISKIIIAYEPIWAIGTGLTATKVQAQEVHRFVFQYLIDNYSQSIADAIPILYGGSCNDSNALELFHEDNIDGGLIGGASLDLKSFQTILSIAEKLNQDN